MENRQNSTNINWYPGHMAKTKRLIEEMRNLIDVVYEVIDARMPYSSKLQEVDSLIKDKPHILIFNKMDLCDKKETQKWMDYYKQKGFHTIGLDLEHAPNLKPLINLTKEIMQEKNSKRTEKGLKLRKSRVLVLGIPNVGKSTLINRLAGKKVETVGNRPGVTKNINWIRINDDLELLDTPGILWPKFESQTMAFNLASLSAIREEILPLDEVVSYLLKMLYKYYPAILKERYGLDSIDENDLLPAFEFIGKKRGCLVRGGEVDYDKVISVIMNDIRNNYIKNITFDRFGEQ